MGSRWELLDQVGIEVGTRWEPGGIELGTFGSSWDQVGIEVGSRWELLDQVGIKVGTFGIEVGTFGSSWGRTLKENKWLVVW